MEAWIAVYVLAGLGLLVNLLGVTGLIRFPDAYTRLHAATKCTTLGSILLGLSVVSYFLFFDWNYPQSVIMVTHMAAALMALLIAAATESHAIARAAYRSGLKPIAVVDELEGKK
jgi:multicomponent Na+:H+ antiporter subunit G